MTQTDAHYQAAQARGLAALDDIRPGDKIFVGSGCADPQALLTELVRRGEDKEISGTTAYQMFGGSANLLAGFAGPHNTVVAFTATAALESAQRLGHATYVPWTIFATSELISTGELDFDVALISTSPPDRHGFLSLGVSVDFAYEVSRRARLVVAEVNNRMPRTYGVGSVHSSRLAGLIEVSRPLNEVVPAVPGPVAHQVAANVLPFIPDGASIEIGVGRIMSAILATLRDRNDISLHTGLFVDGMIDLIESGIITNRRKRQDQGVSVANQARGTQRLYDFVDDNPSVQFRPASYTHSPEILAALPDFRAINSALQVDLSGRVNSEMVGARRVSSTGGLGDFARAGRYNRGARSIIALAATADGGRLSRIVPTLRGGADVTLPTDLADVVVTEFGAADLRAKTPPERAEALISVAAPEHRPALREALAASSPV